MKPKIHPQLNDMVVHFPDGTTQTVKSASKKKDLHMEIHFAKHPAWNANKAVQTNTADAAVVGYNKKFGNFGDNLDSLFDE
ncbi:MAG: 50S ribosomal protein L31 [Pseudomonadota bacterium]